MVNTSCLVLGAGHNGLAAACYLAKAGLKVTVLEKNQVYGGAAISAKPFAGVEANLSRYSYLVSLLPKEIISELGLNLKLLSRPVSSFTPTQDGKALLIERVAGAQTKQSFVNLTDSDVDFDNWIKFYQRVEKIAQVLAPTLLEPLKDQNEIKSMLEQVDPAAWDDFFVKPIGQTIDESFESDLVKGIVLTDALIGTFSDGFDSELLANRCFLYHLIGDGSGEWKVPKGGMGAVTSKLYEKAISLGVEVILNTEVTKLELNENAVSISSLDGQTWKADYAVSNIAPSKLASLRGKTYSAAIADGSQIKMNLLLKKLPRLISGHDESAAFSGTFHIDESMSEIKAAYQAVCEGRIPELLPAEIYCHTLTDSSILSDELAQQGHHTITLFGLLMKASLFDESHDETKQQVQQAYLNGLNKYLLDDIYDCLALDENGEYCIEVKTPQDIESSVGLPRGHIFHEDLKWPFAQAPNEVGSWGTETDHARLFNCSSAARRGGGVSAIAGRNAALALLKSSEI
jgi:phytoene dehydrogenase-like protein